VVLIDGIADVAQAGAFADGLLRTLGTPYRGRARRTRHGEHRHYVQRPSLQPCGRRAARRDTAMYHAKGRGQGAVRVFDRADARTR